ncbi:MAG: 16S rRNA (cytosine(967)-C(5))-methyltransferase RsmB [Actinobacteria bacterium]|nr:16S rRNA (cytosine(967)-C(5))-methyltransferase RsmB [Actinomycetota bacterium]
MMGFKRDNPGKSNPRLVALKILCSYFRQPASLKKYLSGAFMLDYLSGLDRRFIFNLVKGTVRHYMLLDHIITGFSVRKKSNIDPRIMNILRMAVYQVLFMDRVPGYSIVDESVEMAKTISGKPSAGFVNAVLRKITGREDILVPEMQRLKKSGKSSAEVISIRYSYPLWLVKYWIEYYGVDKTEKICTILNSNPVFNIRLNELKIKDEKHLDNVKKELFEEIPRVKHLSYPEISGVRFDTRSTFLAGSTMDLEKSRLYREGLVTVHNLLSQFAVNYYLNPNPGEAILDVCAAPGGKTAYASQLMKNRGLIISVDVSSSRIELMQENLVRMGVENAVIVNADATRKGFLTGRIKYWQDGIRWKKGTINENCRYPEFDRVLVDAPCSSLGTASKNPEVKYSHSMEDIKRLAGIQYKILSNSGEYLKEGGRMVYYTCTLSPIENKLLMESFVSKSGGSFIIDKDFYPGEGESTKNCSCIEIMPPEAGGEAAFICVLKKVKN